MEDVLSGLDASKVERWRSVSDCSEACRWLLGKIGPRKVIEVGTAYGHQLGAFVPLSSKTVCVDPMYEWVPDVQDYVEFDEKLVHAPKLAEWRRNAAPHGDRVELIVGSSFAVAGDARHAAALADADVLIVDGCHHPWEMPLRDYRNFKRHMRGEHFVIWDDLQMEDVARATRDVSGFGAQVRFGDALIMQFG